jgi:hypothetical protein
MNTSQSVAGPLPEWMAERLLKAGAAESDVQILGYVEHGLREGYFSFLETFYQDHGETLATLATVAEFARERGFPKTFDCAALIHKARFDVPGFSCEDSHAPFYAMALFVVRPDLVPPMILRETDAMRLFSAGWEPSLSREWINPGLIAALKNQRPANE